MRRFSIVLLCSTLCGRYYVERQLTEFLNFHYVNRRKRRGGYIPITVLCRMRRHPQLNVPVCEVVLTTHDCAHSLELKVDVGTFFFGRPQIFHMVEGVEVRC